MKTNELASALAALVDERVRALSAPSPAWLPASSLGYETLRAVKRDAERYGFRVSVFGHRAFIERAGWERAAEQNELRRTPANDDDIADRLGLERAS